MTSESIKDELIQTYEAYVGLLGEELKELTPLAAIHGWQSKRLKAGADFRAKIAELRNKVYSYEPIQDKPILVGYLNTQFGYNGFKKIPIGAPVYLLNDRYYFEMFTPSGERHIQKFHKETLHPCINFIKE